MSNSSLFMPPLYQISLGSITTRRRPRTTPSLRRASGARQLPADARFAPSAPQNTPRSLPSITPARALVAPSAEPSATIRHHPPPHAASGWRMVGAWSRTLPVCHHAPKSSGVWSRPISERFSYDTSVNWQLPDRAPPHATTRHHTPPPAVESGQGFPTSRLTGGAERSG